MPEIREVLSEIARRLGEVPDRSADLAKEQAQISDRLDKVTRFIGEIEARVAGEVVAEKDAFPDAAARRAEVSRRLSTNWEYRTAKDEAGRLRTRLRELDAEAQRLSLRHEANTAVLRLASALYGSGQAGLADEVLSAYHNAFGGIGICDGDSNGNGAVDASGDATAQGQVFPG